MSNIRAFQRTLLPEDTILELEKFQEKVDSIWKTYIENNEVLWYEEELKKEFDKNFTRMKRGYQWDEEKIISFLEEISYFPDNLEDLLFLILAFTSLVSQMPDILKLSSEKIEELNTLVLELEYPPNMYLSTVRLYLNKEIQDFFEGYGFSHFQKTSVFARALESLHEGNKKLNIWNIILMIEKTPFFKVVQKKTNLLGNVILNIEKLYDQLLEDIQIMESTSEEEFDISLYERITHILNIKNLPLEVQASYLTEINALDQQEMNYLDKLFFIVDITDTFLEENMAIEKIKQ